MNNAKLFIITVLIAGVLAPASAFSATQGSLGTTSTATADITVIIPAKFRISGLNDFSFGAYPGSGNLSANNDICIYSNNANGDYKVRVTDSSSMSAAGFSVQNGTATADIPYSVKWNATTGTAGNQAVTYNTAHAKTGANTQSTDCTAGGNSANMQVDFASGDLLAAPGGSYNSTLTISIEP